MRLEMKNPGARGSATEAINGKRSTTNLSFKGTATGNVGQASRGGEVAA